MRAGTAAALVATVLLAAVSPAAAWTPHARIRMADDAVRLMPETLRLVLERHREDLLRGILEPVLEEDGPPHRAAQAGGSLDASVAREAAALVAAVEGAAPLAEIAHRFGVLAHFVQDAGFPPGVGDAPADRYRHFGEIVESRRQRFPLVFLGHADPDLDRHDYGAFARRMAAEAIVRDGDLDRAYARAAAAPGDASAFDDRSVPFAIASLSYSSTVTGMARIWVAVWGRAHGDLGRTPYLDPDTRARRKPAP